MSGAAPARPGIGPVAVATDAPAIAEAVERAGGRAVMTRDDHASGSDRIFEAVEAIDPRRPPRRRRERAGRPARPSTRAAIAASIEPLADPPSTSRRSSAEIAGDEERTNPNVVKLVGSAIAPGRLRALYFTRATAPSGEGPLYHHIGALRLSPPRARALRRAAALAARAARAARAAARARGRHAHRRHPPRRRAARRRHARRPGARARRSSARTTLMTEQDHRLPGRARRELPHRLPGDPSRTGSRCPARPSRTPSRR